MKSSKVVAQQIATYKQYNDLRKDASMASFFMVVANDTPNTSVKMYGGFIRLSSLQLLKKEDVTLPITMPTSNNKIALISINLINGDIVTTYSAEATSPTIPSVPIDTSAICTIFLKPGTVIKDEDDLVNSYIEDTRSPILSGGDMLNYENLAGLEDFEEARNNLSVYSKSEVVTLIDNATVGLLDDRGSFDASVNTFPTAGGSGTAGAIKKGDLWFISIGGTLGGQIVTVGDSVRALVDNPGQTSTNWNIIEVNINYVPENQANKVTDVDANKTSNTFFASVKAIYDWATGLFYTKSEINSLASNYYTKTALDGGQLDNRYYTESEINSLAGNYALKTGATFTGAISATNLSNTNTGDQTITSGAVTATAGQTVFTTPTYVLGNNKLMVFVNGFLQEKTTHYTETSTTSITFGTGLDVGGIVTYRILS